LWIKTLQVIANHQVCDWKEFSLPAIFTADFRFFANPTHPLVTTSRLVTLLARFKAFEAPWINILAPAKQVAK
jgi:hypothetical protein